MYIDVLHSHGLWWDAERMIFKKTDLKKKLKLQILKFRQEKGTIMIFFNVGMKMIAGSLWE